MNKFVKGALIASAVAGLVMSTTACSTPGNNTQQIKCGGVNDCSGQGACGAADGSHDCAGKNDCKGQGWKATTEADCTSQGGQNLGPVSS